MGEALRGSAEGGTGRGGTLGRRAKVEGRRHWPRLVLFLCLLLSIAGPSARAQIVAPARLDSGRFTFVFYPSEQQLAHSLLSQALASDTFPGLPRPTQRVLIALAPDHARFREWIGPTAPEWGAAIAFPESHRIVMQGRGAGSDAGDPREVFRHELAHLALHEGLGDLPPRWFDEGYASYAARELDREDALAANVSLALRGMPTFDELEASFNGATSNVQAAYALSYRAVSELAALDPVHGLTLYFENWKSSGSMDRAMRSTYGLTKYQFEDRWRSRTRRRYGMLALFGDFTLAGLVVAVLVVPLYIARRRRDKRRMAALVQADAAAERAAHASMLEALLAVETAARERGGSGVTEEIAEPERREERGDEDVRE